MSTNSSSILSQILAEVLIGRALNPTGNSFEPDIEQSSTRHSLRTPTTHGTMRNSNSIFELSREYTNTINNYNSNISEYNRIMERIIRVIETGTAGNSVPLNNRNRRETTPTDDSRTEEDTDTNHNSGLDISGVPVSQISTDESTTVNNRTLGHSSLRPSFFTIPPAIPNRFRYGNRPYSSAQINAGERSSSDYSQLNNIQTYSNIINALRIPRVLSHHARDGLNDTQIQNATIEIIFDPSNTSLPTQCHISLDDFTPGEQLLQIRNCNHVFKPAGLRRWLAQHTRCPVCRCNVTNNTVSESISNPIQSHHPFTNRANVMQTPQNDPTTDYTDMPELINAESYDNNYLDNPHIVRDYEVYDYDEEPESYTDNNNVASHPDSNILHRVIYEMDIEFSVDPETP